MLGCRSRNNSWHLLKWSSILVKRVPVCCVFHAHLMQKMLRAGVRRSTWRWTSSQPLPMCSLFYQLPIYTSTLLTALFRLTQQGCLQRSAYAYCWGNNSLLVYNLLCCLSIKYMWHHLFPSMHNWLMLNVLFSWLMWKQMSRVGYILTRLSDDSLVIQQYLAILRLHSMVRRDTRKEPFWFSKDLSQRFD